MRAWFLSFIIAGAALTRASGAASIPADDPNIRYTGRIDFGDSKAPIMWWPGCEVVARFQGTSVGVNLTDYGDNYFYAIIDDSAPVLLNSSRGARTYTVATGLVDTVHSLCLFKRTETQEGQVAFTGLELDDGCRLVPPPPRSPRRIEYFGDSITSGHSVASTTGDTNEAWGKDNYYAYGAVAARDLGAEFHCISVSGIGLYVDKWGLGGNMKSLFYDKTTSSTTWDFNQWIPHVVVVNLGQNDSWGSYTQEAAEEAYVDFVLTLRGHYPDAYIVLALGSMNATAPGSPWPQYLQNAADVLRDTHGDTKVLSLVFPFSGASHPSAARQEDMAHQLTALLRRHVPGFQEPVPASAPAIVHVEADAGGQAVTLYCNSMAGEIYELESRSDPLSGTWIPVTGSAAAASNTTTSLTAPMLRRESAYRVVHRP